jgi:hypothetical protein
MAWPKGAEHWRTPDFKLNVSAGYDVEFTYKAHFPPSTDRCLISQRLDCGEPLSSIDIVSTVSASDKNGGDTVQPVQFNDSERHYNRFTYEYARTLGLFRGQAGQMYYLEFRGKIPPEAVEKLQPRIRATISPAWLEKTFVAIDLIYLGILVAGFVSVCLIIGGIIGGWRNRRKTGVATNYSSTTEPKS